MGASDPALDGSGNPVLWSFSSPVGISPPRGCEVIGIPPSQMSVPNLIAVHPWNWTFTGPGGSTTSDDNRANFCLSGNIGADPSRSFFLDQGAAGANIQCDTEGDLAMSLLRAKGVPVEVLCRANADADLNGQTGCNGTAIPIALPADRNCRGVTYLCITHPPAPPPQPPQP